MDKIIDTRFERVEKALATLITSISTYNPSPALATDLVAADAELSQGLEQCEPTLPSHLSVRGILTCSLSINPPIQLCQDTVSTQYIQLT